MEKLLFSLSFFVIITTFSACAQSKNIVVKANGYFIVRTPGTIEADDNGQPIERKRDSLFLLFIEAPTQDIKWQHAWKMGQSFSVIPSIPSKTKVVVGTTKNGNKKIEITPAKGNQLWQLELSDDQQKAKPPQPVGTNEILISGISKNKTFFTKVNVTTQLTSPMYQ